MTKSEEIEKLKKVCVMYDEKLEIRRKEYLLAILSIVAFLVIGFLFGLMF